MQKLYFIRFPDRSVLLYLIVRKLIIQFFFAHYTGSLMFVDIISDGGVCIFGSLIHDNLFRKFEW